MHSKRLERRNGRVRVQESLASPSSKTGSNSPDSLVDFFFSPVLKKKIAEMRLKTRVNLVREGLQDLTNRYSPVDYRPEYAFQQDWEQSPSYSEFKQQNHDAQNSTHLQITIQWIILIAFGFTLWFLSIYRVFDVGRSSVGPIASIIVLILCDSISKEWLLYRNGSEGEQGLKKIIVRHGLPFLFLSYLIVLLFGVEFGWLSSLTLLPVDLLFLAYIYTIIKKKYVKLRIKLMSSSWRNEVEIAQLVGGCLQIVHVFSIVLKLASASDPNLNWTQNIDIFEESWLNRYMYSLYFTCSTMFTVGYGDITPKNKWEIASILVVQVVGIINIGYVINEVGRFVSIINQGQNRLYRNLSDTEKMASNYNLPKNLASKMRSYFISNEIVSNKFNVEEEDKLMQRVGENIAQEVVSHNKLHLVRTSLFFLCHWTKKLQNHVALQLQRNVYKPGDILLQSFGSEKIYILERGKVNICKGSDFKTCPSFENKSLKTLELNKQRGVELNVYGYSALISGLKVNLSARVKDYSICFSIPKSAFTKLINQNSKDFEYFHEIRSRIEESYCKEVWQAPKINHPKEHYVPLIYLIIRKAKGKFTKNQKREDFLRNERSSFKVIPSQILNTDKNIDGQIKVTHDKESRISIEDAVKKMFFQQLQKSVVNTDIPKLINDESLLKVDVEEQTPKLTSAKEQLLLSKFQSVRNYNNFRPKFNYTNRIEKYNQKFYKSFSTELQQLSDTLNSAFDNVDHEMKRKLMKSKIIF